jgi:hypothetical protein
VVARKTLAVPRLGRSFGLVPRDQLRFRSHGRRFAASAWAAPAAFDWSRGESLKFPIDGNDQFGDCYYAAVAHASQTYTGNSGTECSFDVGQLTRRYLQISGGDNGLDDGTIIPEWKAGIVGPNGPRKILDELTVDPRDVAACIESAWAGGGLVWTCSLLNTWQGAVSPGVLWDANGRPDPMAGHAMFLTGRRADGTWDVRTWGISPPVRVTHAGILAADSELIVAFSADQFDPATGRCAFSGMTWEEKRAWWKARGGKDVGPSPFAPPAPAPVPPSPAPPASGGRVWVDLHGDLLAVNYEGRQISARLNADKTLTGSWS